MRACTCRTLPSFVRVVVGRHPCGSVHIAPDRPIRTHSVPPLGLTTPHGTARHCAHTHRQQEFDEIHFFGDKTFEGGNDFEIFTHPRVKGHTVTSPEDTVAQLTELFFK